MLPKRARHATRATQDAPLHVGAAAGGAMRCCALRLLPANGEDGDLCVCGSAPDSLLLQQMCWAHARLLQFEWRGVWRRSAMESWPHHERWMWMMCKTKEAVASRDCE